MPNRCMYQFPWENTCYYGWWGFITYWWEFVAAEREWLGFVEETKNGVTFRWSRPLWFRKGRRVVEDIDNIPQKRNVSR